MAALNDGGLRLALGRLKWALGLPQRHTADDWDRRLVRALAALETSWDRHARATEGTFAQVVDPSHLPFTPLSRRIREFSRDHSDFGAEVTALQDELAQTPSLYDASFAPGQVHAAERLAEVRRRVERLLAAMQWHLTMEGVLLEAEVGDG
jgi:hypothetical protein